MNADTEGPRTWVADGEEEWVGTLLRVRPDGRAVVLDPRQGRVLAGWAPWEAPPRVVAVACAACDHATTPDALVRDDVGIWLCQPCELAAERTPAVAVRHP